MGEKSQRKTTAKPAARSLKEKRADKKGKASNNHSDVVANVGSKKK